MHEPRFKCVANKQAVWFDMPFDLIRSSNTLALGSVKQNCDIGVRVKVSISCPMKLRMKAAVA